MRRTLTLALALGLAGWGPVPVSACALLSSLFAECATPERESCCDQMNADEGGNQLVAAAEMPCCFVSKAPLPDSQYKAPDVSLTTAPSASPHPMGDAPGVQQMPPVLLVQDLSPPRTQSLLCIFLI